MKWWGVARMQWPLLAYHVGLSSFYINSPEKFWGSQLGTPDGYLLQARELLHSPQLTTYTFYQSAPQRRSINISDKGQLA
jgi:hypothetical protein